MIQESKRMALQGLKGRWIYAIFTCFIAMLFCANCASASSKISFNFTNIQDLISPSLASDSAKVFSLVLLVVASVYSVWGIVCFVVSGVMKLGYATYNLNIVDGKEAKFSLLFTQYGRLGDGFVMGILIAVFTILWSLLFIIPGIIKSYAYAMTPYILAEHPEMKPKEAIDTSVYLMDGNKLDLFLLHLSFLGWKLLSVVPYIAVLPLLFMGRNLILILGFCGAFVISSVISVVVTTYVEAAQAAFYRCIACEADPVEEVQEDPEQ